MAQLVEVLPAMQETTCSAGDPGSIPGVGRYPGKGDGNPFRYSCLEKSHGQRSLAGCNAWGHKSRTELGDKSPPYLELGLLLDFSINLLFFFIFLTKPFLKIEVKFTYREKHLKYKF